jgi:hypothetical protein
MQIGLNQWASAITTQIQQAPDVEMTTTALYEPISRNLLVKVSGIGKEALTGELRVSVMLTESGIVDAQDDSEAGGIVDNYVHKHVLRAMLTPAAGAKVSDGLAAGATFNQQYTFTIPAEWNPDLMEVIAFVSLVNGNNFPVLQASQVHVHE